MIGEKKKQKSLIGLTNVLRSSSTIISNFPVFLKVSGQGSFCCCRRHRYHYRYHFQKEWGRSWRPLQLRMDGRSRKRYMNYHRCMVLAWKFLFLLSFLLVIMQVYHICNANMGLHWVMNPPLAYRSTMPIYECEYNRSQNFSSYFDFFLLMILPFLSSSLSWKLSDKWDDSDLLARKRKNF